MRITYDPAKRERTLRERGLDFEDAVRIFEGRTFEVVDSRKDYGEVRVRCFGLRESRLVVVVYVQRGDARHVVSMRKCNDREEKRIRPHLAD